MPLGQHLSPIHKMAIATVFILFVLLSVNTKQEPIYVGILYTFDQPNEARVTDAILMAIAEINKLNGLLGKTIEPIILDGKSTKETFQEAAESLINDHNISVFFGCSTDLCRQTLKPIVEKNDRLLFYPTSFQGLEHSNNIFYIGSIPNQWITPTLSWSSEHIGKRFILLGSHSTFSRATHSMIKKQMQALNTELVAEFYTDHMTPWPKLIELINNNNADLLINTLNAQDTFKLFDHAQHKPLSPATLSFQFSTAELSTISRYIKGQHYFAASYFQDLNTAINTEFIHRHNSNINQTNDINSSFVAAYSSVYLWAHAVSKSNTLDPSIIRTALKGSSFQSPEGEIVISARNNYSWKSVHIIQLTDNTINLIWSTPQGIQPQAYPLYRTEQQWQQIISPIHSPTSQDEQSSTPPPTEISHQITTGQL